MPKQPSRAERWGDACVVAVAALATLQELQTEYQDWYDGMPESLQGSPTGEKLFEITQLDLDGALATLEDAEGADLPLGFGRD